MNKLISNGVTRRSLSVVLALVLLTSALGLMFPGKVCACWAEKTIYTFYSDATYTTQVGRCVENGCTGVITCSGQQTEFEKTTTGPLWCSGC